MVRRGSTVRVRQRALQKPRQSRLFLSKELARTPVCGGYGAGYGALRFRIVEHVCALERAAERLRGEETPRAVEAITAIADEEAGKFLILLDVTRCAYLDAAKKRDQLRVTRRSLASSRTPQHPG